MSFERLLLTFLVVVQNSRSKMYKMRCCGVFTSKYGIGANFNFEF